MQETGTYSFLDPDAVVRAAHIQEGMQVADFHAASGFMARAAARAVGAGGRVWAVDARQDLLIRLKNTAAMEGLENVEIVRGNMERRGGSLLPEESMDYVLLVSALCAVEDREGAIEEAWRVLRGNGRLLVIDWKESAGGGLGPSPAHVITAEAAKKLLVRGGFAIIGDTIPAGAYHWGILLRKRPV